MKPEEDYAFFFMTQIKYSGLFPLKLFFGITYYIIISP